MKNLKVGLAFVGDKKMQELNKTYRGVDAPTDVLAFPTTKISPRERIFWGR